MLSNGGRVSDEEMSVGSVQDELINTIEQQTSMQNAQGYEITPVVLEIHLGFSGSSLFCL